MRNALEREDTNIDTAQRYGESETIIGRTLSEWSAPRPLVATKVRFFAPQGWHFPTPMTTMFPTV
jgi:aryl-alcohol dehydrogenase-like predicted oxidoreductase